MQYREAASGDSGKGEVVQTGKTRAVKGVKEGSLQRKQDKDKVKRSITTVRTHDSRGHASLTRGDLLLPRGLISGGNQAGRRH
jgi:hypothetical protein